MNPESSKHNIYLAEIQHPTEIPDDARHFCNLLSAFFISAYENRLHDDILSDPLIAKESKVQRYFITYV